jgi:hypothetical protein
MRKERTLSRSNKKPSDEFSPSAPEKEFAYLHNTIFFQDSELGLKAPPEKEAIKTQL